MCVIEVQVLKPDAFKIQEIDFHLIRWCFVSFFYERIKKSLYLQVNKIKANFECLSLTLNIKLVLI